MTMQEPPNEQIIAGKIARGAIQLAKKLCNSDINLDGLRLDSELETYIRDKGGEPALKGYHPAFADRPYKWTICLGVNNDVVHGVPDKIISRDDLITVDLVVKYQGWYVDTARTFTYSDDIIKQQFVKASRMIFEIAKDVVMPEQPMALFGTMVERGAQIQGYSVIKDYSGHGIGRTIHAAPQVPSYYTPNTGTFQVGRSYAIEPVLAIESSYKLQHNEHDGFSVSANCLSSHFEDTIFISKKGTVNLTA